MLKINVINQSANPLPVYETTQAAGMDLRANLTEPIIIHPMERALLPTGLFMEIPAGYEAQIRPRSGLALKHGITVLNSPGTIDADYRGEIKVLLINLSNQPFKVNHGERIAQMIINQHQTATLEAVEILNQTTRGAGGYGSTGKH